jgi:hypothetical protein
VNDDIHISHGALQAVFLTYIADEVAQDMVIIATYSHFMLLELVTAEYDQFIGLVP